jgi:hypothetical protein
MVLEQCCVVGLRLWLASYVVLDTVVLVGRRRGWLLFQGNSSRLRALQAWWVEASRASPDLPSNSRWVGSHYPMPYTRRIRLSFATVRAVCFPCRGKSHHGLATWQHRSACPAASARCEVVRAMLRPSPGGASVGCKRMNLRSWGTEPSSEAAARLGRSLRSRGPNAWVGRGPMDEARPPSLGNVGPVLLASTRSGCGPPLVFMIWGFRS